MDQNPSFSTPGHADRSLFVRPATVPWAVPRTGETLIGLPANWSNIPNPARVYDWLLGGGDNYQVDEALAGYLTLEAEWLRTAATINRIHNALTTTRLASFGITQFLDLGCGYPSPPSREEWSPNTHEAAGSPGSASVVVYVDKDSVVTAHARARLEERPGVTAVQGDIVTGLDRILTLPDIDFLDRSRPIAVLLHDVLPYIADDEAVQRLLTTLRDWLPSGSALSITHATADLSPDEMAAVTSHYTKARIAYRPRDKDHVQALFGDWPQLGPGVVPTAHWHPDHPHAHEQPYVSGAYAGVAITPGAVGRT
ncbi:SAM-dependent methyltransferase [Streptomyces sp. NPDC004838]